MKDKSEDMADAESISIAVNQVESISEVQVNNDVSAHYLSKIKFLHIIFYKISRPKSFFY